MPLWTSDWGRVRRLGDRMKRYTIHASTSDSTALVFATDSTTEVGYWLSRHGPGTPDLTVTDHHEQRDTRVQRGQM
jgi:hypothetical protein